MENKQSEILIAGATGYLGNHITRVLTEYETPYRALVRNTHKARERGIPESNIVYGEVTDPASLSGVCDGVDVVISTVGITRQKDNLRYWDVDYQGNLNLLNEAKRAGVRQFVYVSVLCGEQLRHLKICDAKEAFVDALAESGIDYTVIRPNGFFSDMGEFFEMARKGRVFLFGDGAFHVNPIHGEDLARFIIEHLDSPETSLEVGGPHTFTHNEIAEIAFRVMASKTKITYIPHWIRRMVITLVRAFTPGTIHGGIEFFLTGLAMDMIAPAYGTHSLEGFFRELQATAAHESIV